MIRRTPDRRPSPLWYLLLLAPFIAMFWVSSYNSVEPAWGAGLALIVYFATWRYSSTRIW